MNGIPFRRIVFEFNEDDTVTIKVQHMNGDEETVLVPPSLAPIFESLTMLGAGSDEANELVSGMIRIPSDGTLI